VTPRGVVDAIKDGRTEYRIVSRLGNRYVRRAYSVLHRLKGHTGPPTDRPRAE